MFKKTFIFSLLLSAFSAQAMLTHKTHEFVKQNRPGVFKDTEGFAVRKNGSVSRVNSYDVDPALRKLTPAQVSQVSKYITTNRMTNGDLALRLGTRLNGGGGGGATVGYWLGWGGVNILAQTGIILTSIGVGIATTASTGNPLAGKLATKAAYKTINVALQVPIQALAQKAAIAGGIMGGVATGPA